MTDPLPTDAVPSPVYGPADLPGGQAPRSPEPLAGKEAAVEGRPIGARPALAPVRRTPGGRLRARLQALQEVPDALADRAPFDPYLSLKTLASYSEISVRKLRSHLSDPVHPLPHHRLGGKILVRRSEFDAWLAAYRRVGSLDVGRLVEEALDGLAVQKRRVSPNQRRSTSQTAKHLA